MPNPSTNSPLKVHYLQHAAFEGIGALQGWLDANHCTVSSTHLYAETQQAQRFPDPDQFDALIIMGGPMSVHDTEQHPWLVEEKAFIRAAFEAGKSILGICLGAQLIAESLGGTVYANSEKEIGWFHIHNVIEDQNQSDKLFQLPQSMNVFHWHGETFRLPESAHRLASSAVTENQAFQIGEQVIGLQFHLETTPSSAEAIIDACQSELEDTTRYVQSAEQMKATALVEYKELHFVMRRLLDYLFLNLDR